MKRQGCGQFFLFSWFCRHVSLRQQMFLFLATTTTAAAAVSSVVCSKHSFFNDKAHTHTHTGRPWPKLLLRPLPLLPCHVFLFFLLVRSKLSIFYSNLNHHSRFQLCCSVASTASRSSSCGSSKLLKFGPSPLTSSRSVHLQNCADARQG